MPSALYSVVPVPVETEIKFRVDNLPALAARLQSAGFRLETPRSFESNTLYDTPDRQMRARTEILRIRSYAGHWTLTHKRLPSAGEPGPALPEIARHKHRVETETQIAHGRALAELFLSLGLVAAFRYEKWRTEWADPGEHGAEGHCVIDETPIGNYAELEGSSEWIDRAALRLGIAPANYITLSYGRLFDQWRQQHRSTAEELTFAAVAASMR
jgi:adenylate cyclase, class 2